MKRVLVTRPEPGASATAHRLLDMGFEPVVVPLARIVALPMSEAGLDCDSVAVTSVNALRHAPETLLRLYAGKPCFAVGAKTADAARNAGFVQVEQAEGDAGSLAARIIGKVGTGSRIAYLAGRVRLADFEEALSGAGLAVMPIEVYDTVPRDPSVREIEALRTGRPIAAVLVYSAKAAEALQHLAKRPDLVETFSQAMHCCLSRRIAERLAGVDHKRIRVAERPEEAAILALLAR